MGWTGRKALVEAGFRRIDRIGTRIVARPRLPLLAPAVTPDLFRGPDWQAPLSPGFPRIADPGQAWTPEQVRGDRRRAEMVSPIGIQPVPKLNRTPVDSFRP